MYSFTPAPSESYTETKIRPPLHTNQQPPSIRKSIKTRGI